MEAINRFGEAPNMRYSIIKEEDMRVIMIFTLRFYENQELFKFTTSHILANAFKLSEEEQYK